MTMSTQDSGRPHAETGASGHKTAVLAIVLVSYLMIVLDISIVITGLPRIRDGLGFSPTDLSWVQNAYTLSFGGLLMLGARAGDLFGRRRMFIVGLALFTASSLAIGLAQAPWQLLAARAIQGVGAAILAPSTLALLSTNFAEGAERTRAMAYYAAVAGVGATMGLVLGGLFAGWLSWRVGFFINVPVGAGLVFAARRYLAESERRTGGLDLMGALMSTLGMTALVYGIVRSASAGWTDAWTLGSVGAGVVMLGLFILNEARAPQPILPLRLFADRQRSAAYATRLLFLGGMVGFWFFTTQFLQNVLGYSPVLAGLAFVPTTLPNFAAAMMTPRLTRRFGNGRVLAGGLAISVVGMAWLSQVSAGADYLTGLALPMVLIGVGQGGTLGPLTIAGVAGVAPRDAGAASGLVNVAHQLGGSLGLGILVVIFAAAGSGGVESPTLLAHGIAAAFTGAAVMLTLALLIAVTQIARLRRAPGK
jgi:EmrB/QacA subfamily drug resistance transporter